MNANHNPCLQKLRLVVDPELCDEAVLALDLVQLNASNFVAEFNLEKMHIKGHKIWVILAKSMNLRDSEAEMSKKIDKRNETNIISFQTILLLFQSFDPN